MVVMGGYIMSRENVKKRWIWGYWTSPLMYAQNAISVNEFFGKSWKHVLPGTTQPLGVLVLKSRGMFTDESWFWIGVATMVGYIFLFNGLFPLALAFLNPFGKPQATLSEEMVNEKHKNKTGESKGDEIQSSVSKGSRSAQTEATNADLSRKKGMILPFEPLSITFENIKYSVDMPQEMKAKGFIEDRLTLLKGVSGAFRPGVLTALMGISGVGKTTLMDVLAGRKTGGYIEGTINISGYPKKQETFARISGYCEQNDIHSPNLTVYESLLYSAWLRLPAEVDSKTRKEFIEEVMELVELASLRGALVGLPGVDGLSTEQRKRLTIAVELVANPSIIFMDEPTSGLDARAAAIVMRTVRNTVDTGRTVVCTIHQPSIDIFEAFDELFLMKSGGEEIYVGPLGHNSCHLVSYFEGIHGVSKIKDGYNPATWMLEVTKVAQEEALGANFTEIYKNSDLYRRTKALIKELTYNAVRLSFTAFTALRFGTMFWNLGPKRSKQQDVFNTMGSMFAATVFLGIQNASGVQPVVAVERTVYYREKAAGLYSALPYAFAQVAIEFPYVLVQTLIYGLIVYAMIAFEWTAVKFFWYIFIMYFTLLYFTFYGMMTVAMTPNYNIAAVVSVSIYGIWDLFAGFLIPRPRIPIWWRWYSWACPIAWTLYGLVASQFGDLEDKLDTGLTVKQFVETYFGFRHDFLGVVAVVLIGFAVLFAFVFAFSIKMFNFQKR
ncbi:hypothetical protein AAC387_Pa05g2085 [Persea americana]